MNFPSRNPTEIYTAFDHHGLSVFLNQSDLSGDTIPHAQAACDRHGLNRHNGYKAAQVYYLRGRTTKVDHERVLIGIVETDTLPSELYEIVHCLSFWNQEGEKCYAMNKSGQESYPDFILRCIAADCRAFVNPHGERFITGKGGNHVWVADNATKERLLIIHF